MFEPFLGMNDGSEVPFSRASSQQLKDFLAAPPPYRASDDDPDAGDLDVAQRWARILLSER